MNAITATAYVYAGVQGWKRTTQHRGLASKQGHNTEHIAK